MDFGNKLVYLFFEIVGCKQAEFGFAVCRKSCELGVVFNELLL